MRIFKHTVGILILAVFAALAIGSGTMEGATARPGTTESYFQMGVAAVKRGDYDQAIAHFDQVIRLNPDSSYLAKTYNNRGWSYYLKGDFDQAITDATKAIQLDPNLANAYGTRGHAYNGKRDIDMAIEDFNQSIRLNPNMDTLFNGRGLAYYNKGDIDRAIADFETALKLDPNNADTKRYLAQAQQGGEMPTQQQGNQTPAQQLAQAQQLPPVMAQGNSLAEKLAWVQAFAQSNGNYILEVNADESIGAQALDYSGKTNITITLRGIGANRTISLSSNGSMFYLYEVTMILENNITLKGRSGNDEDYLVCIDNDATFNMSGGTISGNEGGGVEVYGGTFNMSGGTISGNEGGGVSVFGGTFNMSGGTISGNEGGGVYVKDYLYDIATFNMSGGNITGNGNTPDYSGGVFVSDGAFNMSGGNITGNTAYEGGGVYIWAGTFNMSGGTISENFSIGNGGGVYVDRTFTMINGTISGNTAYLNGGGVFIDQRDGTFTKTGGTITGYTSDKDNGNAVKNASNAIQNFRGHAAFVGSDLQTLKIKESTAGPSDNLSYRNGTASGAWDN